MFYCGAKRCSENVWAHLNYVLVQLNENTMEKVSLDPWITSQPMAIWFFFHTGRLHSSSLSVLLTAADTVWTTVKSTSAPTQCPMAACRVTESDTLEWTRNGYTLLSSFQARTLKALFTFTFLCTFHFETEATENGTQVLNLAERAEESWWAINRVQETKEITSKVGGHGFHLWQQMRKHSRMNH